MRILVVGSQSSQTTNRNVNYSPKEIKYNRKVTLRDSTIIERKKSDDLYGKHLATVGKKIPFKEKETTGRTRLRKEQPFAKTS